MTATRGYLVVRSVVPDTATRPPFDHWYSTDHMPLAIARLGALRGWRFWSESDPAVHYACYEFADVRTLSERMNSQELRSLVAEYDRVWPTGVTRTREVIRLVDHVSAQQ